jgi:hypothetical protein
VDSTIRPFTPNLEAESEDDQFSRKECTLHGRKPSRLERALEATVETCNPAGFENFAGDDNWELQRAWEECEGRYLNLIKAIPLRMVAHHPEGETSHANDGGSPPSSTIAIPSCMERSPPIEGLTLPFRQTPAQGTLQCAAIRQIHRHSGGRP